MAKPSYDQFFKDNPKIYEDFKKVVKQSENYYAELQKHSFYDATTCLSIGAGEGELELKLMQNDDIEVGVIEPNPAFVQTFKKQVEAKKLLGIVAEVFTGTFQDYREQKTYDLVISIHSWYAMGLNMAHMVKALSCLAPEAKLFMSVMSKNNPIWQIARLSGNDAGGNFSSESLSEWAKKCGYPHEYFVNKQKVSLATIVNTDGQPTELGKNFISFATFTPWSELSSDLKQQAIEIVTKSALNGQLILDDGCLVFSSRT